MYTIKRESKHDLKLQLINSSQFEMIGYNKLALFNPFHNTTQYKCMFLYSI